MSYRNPQIVQPNKVGQIYGAGLASFGQNVAKGITAYALKQEKIRKEQETELKKQQDLYNKVDVEKAQMTANFLQKTKQYRLSDELRPIATEAIQNYGDAKIALLTETNPSQRAFYNKQLQQSYTTLIDADAFVKAVQGDIKDYSDIKNAQEIGITKGIAATGADATINQEFLQSLSGLDLNGNMKITKADDGSLNLTAYRGDGSEIRTLNSTKYLQSGNSLIYNIPDTATEFLKDVDKQVLNDKGTFKDEFIGDFESQTITIGNNKYNQTYRKVDTDAVVKAAAPAVQAQIAGYNALTNQQKEDVWANQLGQDRNTALTATPEQIAAAYQNLVIKDIGTQPGLTTIQDEYVLASNPQLIKPTTPPKPTKPTQRLVKATDMATLISDSPSIFPLKLNPAGVPTTASFNAKIEIPETTNADTGKKERDDKEFKNNVEKLGFNVIDATDDNDTLVGYDIELKGAKSGTYKLSFDDLPTIKEFYNELLIISGYNPKEAKDVNDEILNILTVRGYQPPKEDTVDDTIVTDRIDNLIKTYSNPNRS